MTTGAIFTASPYSLPAIFLFLIYLITDLIFGAIVLERDRMCSSFFGDLSNKLLKRGKGVGQMANGTSINDVNIF